MSTLVSYFVITPYARYLLEPAIDFLPLDVPRLHTSVGRASHLNRGEKNIRLENRQLLKIA